MATILVAIGGSSLAESDSAGAVKIPDTYQPKTSTAALPPGRGKAGQYPP